MCWATINDKEMIDVSENSLGKILKEMYENAPKDEQVAHIHLFGIKYGLIIKEHNFKATSIVTASGLKASYATELSKGIKLSKYVVVK